MPKQVSQQKQSDQNKESLRKLILTVEANSQSLELLIAICDNRNVQAGVIEQYEEALRKKGIAPFRVRLNTKEPSLKASVAALVAKEPRLRSGEPAVVTVLNAEALLGVTLGEETSEQERFFFSLQWTREALLRFEFAVVLWVPEGIAREMGRRAPDFWSWRGGVFEFEKIGKADVENGLGMQSLVLNAQRQPEEKPLDELLQQVRTLEERESESALLITLYNDLGEAYERRYVYGEALGWYEKALRLAKEKKSLAGQARSLRNIGDSLRSSGRFTDSITYYEQSLEIDKDLGNRQGEAISLGNLGVAYRSLGQYQQAIDFQQQSLEIARELGDRQGEAISHLNTGIALLKLEQKEPARIAFQEAKQIFTRTGQSHYVDKCDEQLERLSTNS